MTDGVDSPQPSLVAGGAITIAGQVARFVIQLALLSVLARLLDPADFGLVAIVTALVGFLTVFGDGGLSLAALQSRVLTAKQQDNLFWLNTGTGLVLAGVLAALAAPIAAAVFRPELVGVSLAISPIFLLTCAGIQFRARLLRAGRFLAVAVADLAGVVIALVSAIAAALLGAGYWSLVVQQLVAAAVPLVVVVVVARWLPGLPSRTEGMRPLLRFGGDTILVQLLTYASTNLPVVLLGRTSGATVTGYFSRASVISSLPIAQLAAPLTRVALASLSTASAVGRLSDRLVAAQRVFAWTLVPAYAAFIALGGPIVLVLLGDQWMPVIPIFVALSAGGIFQSVGYVYYWMFLATGRTRLQLAIELPTRVAMIALIFVGAAWGPIGVAWAVTLGLALVWAASAFVGTRLLGVRLAPLFGATAVPVAVSAVAALGAGLFDGLVFSGQWAIVRLAVGLAVMCGIAALAILAFPGVRASFLRVARTAAPLVNAGRRAPGRSDLGA